jgi:uncharacterized membrane protein
MPTEKRLAAQYKKHLRKERISFLLQKAGIYFHEKFSWMRFGPVFLAVSLFLIFLVGLVLLIKVSTSINLPLVEFSNTTQLAYMGQIGDFFGGVLNPLLSFMALIAVLFTIKMQSKELKEAKEETRIANRIQDKQTAVFERQNFESVLFRLLDVHSRLAERIRTTYRLGDGDRFKVVVNTVLDTVNEEALDEAYEFSELISRMSWQEVQAHRNKANILGLGRLVETVRQVINEEQKILFSQYFRNMYQMLKLIDNFKLEIYEDGAEKGKKSKRQLRMEYFQRRQYCNIIRAQLSDDELKVMFFNCLMPTGFGLRHYVEKYSLLKHMDRHSFLSVPWDWQRVYEETAYSDYEQISDTQIRDFQRERSLSNFSHMFPR